MANASKLIEKQIRQKGFVPLALFRTGVVPGQVFLKAGRSYVNWGDLNNLVQLPSGYQQEVETATVVGFSGDANSSFDGGLGLSLLKELLSALGANVGIDAAYSMAKTLEFDFAGVTQWSVDPADIGQLLAGGVVLPLGSTTKDRLKHKQFCMATQVLGCSEVAVRAKASATTKLDVNVPSIQKIVGAKVKVEYKNQGSFLVNYKAAEGTQPVALGISLWSLHGFDDNTENQIELLKPVKASGTLKGVAPVERPAAAPVRIIG